MSQVFSLTPQDAEEMSMVDIVYALLSETKEPITFTELMNRIAELKNLTQAQMEQLKVQLYTEINLDGRFAFVGNGQWGLKKWYPVEQFEEATQTTPRKKKGLDDDDYDVDLDDYDDYDDDYDSKYEEEDLDELDDLDDFDHDDVGDVDLDDEEDIVDDEDLDLDYEEEEVSLDDLSEEELEESDEEEDQ